MKCPYCQKEMEKGSIYSARNNICWTPDGQRKSIFVNLPMDYEVQLAKLNYFKGCKVIAYRCRDCLVEIIDEKEVKSTKTNESVE